MPQRCDGRIHDLSIEISPVRVDRRELAEVLIDKLLLALDMDPVERFGLVLASLMAKLGARNRVEIAMWAYETGRVGS